MKVFEEAYLQERYELATERIRGMKEGTELSLPFSAFYQDAALFWEDLIRLLERHRTPDKYRELSLEEWEEENQRLYHRLLPAHYENSFCNPSFGRKKLGASGPLLAAVFTQLHSLIGEVYEGKTMPLLLWMELFIELHTLEIYGDGGRKNLLAAIQAFGTDNLDLLYAPRLEEKGRMEKGFWHEIAELSLSGDPRVLYATGEWIGENERQMYAYLHGLTQEEIHKMASTFVEGFLRGYTLAGLSIREKRGAILCYPVGMERVAHAAIGLLEKEGLSSVMYRASKCALFGENSRDGISASSKNPQCFHDHGFDQQLFLSKRFKERKLEVYDMYCRNFRQALADQAGPIYLETFGEKTPVLANKKEALRLTVRQEQVLTAFKRESILVRGRYVDLSKRSFCIIAFPLPEIGPRFPEIFRATMELNTLDPQRYTRIQQHLIDALDQGVYVQIRGRGGNRTDIRVALQPLSQPGEATLFENCVADVNIPVGEVFTTPALTGTSGLLHVSQVYIGTYAFKDLWFQVEDGFVTDYGCGNFAAEEDNRRLVREHILMNQDTLPMGEFAIGTNTTAYHMAKTYDIFPVLPILIAEKTGPHFAFGDTCYSHMEEQMTYNPDGKAIIARDNAVSLLRKTEPEKAYYACHTDITMPYDELEDIQVLPANGEPIWIVREGRFVLPGTEELNGPLDEA